MAQTAYRLPFRLFGIPVQLDITFLLVLPLLAWIIGSQLDRFVTAFALEGDAAQLTHGLTPYVLGLIAAIGLFVSVLIHELGHSLVGKLFHLRIRSITLWILGGMAKFERIPRHRGTEAVMAAAGPVTSFLLGGLSALLLRLIPHSLEGARFILTYLMYMNFVLAAFNLLPALPLDGGRVFRSLLALRFSYLQATQLAASVSRILAVAMGLFGLLSLNVWLILLAFFIYIAVGGESQYATVSSALRGIRVSDVMTRNPHTVNESMTISDLIHHMFAEKYLAYPVTGGAGNLTGFVTLQDVRKVRSEGHDEATLTVADIMSRQFDKIREHQTALDAFQRIGRSSSGRLVVVDFEGKLTGIISKTDLVRTVQVRMVERELDDSIADSDQ